MVFARRTVLRESGILAMAPHTWFRHGVGITIAGSGVSAWANSSLGAGVAAVQATDALRPTVESDGGILFDGVDNLLQTGAFTALTNPVTVYALVKQVAFTANDYLWDGATSAQMGLPQVVASPQIRAQTGGTSFNGGTLSPPIGQYAVVCVVYNTTASVMQLNHGTPLIGTLASVAPTRITLGANGAVTSVWSNVAFKEFLVFNGVAHDSTQRAAIIAYLRRKGGL